MLSPSNVARLREPFGRPGERLAWPGANRPVGSRSVEATGKAASFGNAGASHVGSDMFGLLMMVKRKSHACAARAESWRVKRYALYRRLKSGIAIRRNTAVVYTAAA
jgi:hypothetical protein